MTSPPAQPAQLFAFPVGTVVDQRYEIIGVVGSGGFATVYKARQLRIERELALKILNGTDPLRQSPVFKTRFMREAQAAAQIRHSNVVTIYDYGIIEDSGQPYIAMEHLEGHDLEVEIIRNGPLTPERALTLFIDCLDALAEGHRQGIVHKDLKPSNLFLTAPGTERETLVVLDFGVARSLGEDDVKMTGTGQISGTPRYLTPEYIENQTVTPALDVYQMGLILVEAISGCPAVDGSNIFKCCIAHCHGELNIPDEFKNGPLGPVLRKALAVDYTLRYPSAAEFRDALKAVDPAMLAAPSPTTLKLYFMRREGESGEHIRLALSGANGPFAQSAEFAKTVSDSSQHLAPGVSVELPARDLSLQTGDSIELDQTSIDSFPPPRAPKPQRRPTLFIALAALLLTGAGFLLVWTSRDDVPAQQSPTASESPSQDTVATGVPGNPLGAAPTTEPPTEAPQPEQPDVIPDPIVTVVAKSGLATVEIVSEPPGASVFAGDEDLGKTPLSWTFDEDVPVELRFEKKGFEAVTLKIAPTAGMRVVRTLDVEAPRLEKAARNRPPRDGVRAEPVDSTGPDQKPVAAEKKDEKKDEVFMFAP